MSELSRIETLLGALIDGEHVDVVPQSRIETYLLALLNGDTNVKEPQSRIEAYLYQLCKNGMSGGGITPTGTLEITENGTHDVTNYASANVNVASSGGGSDLDALIDGSITEVSSNVEIVRESAMTYCKSLVTVTLPNAKTIYNSAFSGCALLERIVLPQANEIKGYSFNNCASLKTIDAPLLTIVGVSSLNGCSALESFVSKTLKTLGQSSFYGCTNLKIVDFTLVSKIEMMTFSQCSNLTKVILRNNNVCTLSYTNAFANSPIASGAGYIYVPSALIEDYKVATNWVTFASQFRELESFTVDSTVTGELDESKI